MTGKMLKEKTKIKKDYNVENRTKILIDHIIISCSKFCVHLALNRKSEQILMF